MKEMNQGVPTDEEAARAENGNTVRGINYPANAVRDNLKRLVAEGKVDEAGADAIFWLYSYAQEFGLSYEGVKEKTGVSAAFALFHGNYTAGYDGMVKKILAFKRLEAERSKGRSLGFVQTSTADRVFATCDAALFDGMPAFIYGASQTGKTTALLEYQRRHNHGTTKYVRMGVRWSKRRIIREIARVCNCFCATAHSADLEERIVKSLNNRMLLIVDEFHLAMETTTPLAEKEVIEYIREIFDRTGCGIVMCATKVGETDFEQGRNKMLFDQFRRRGIIKTVLPDVPPVRDLNKIAKEFGLGALEGETLAQVKRMIVAHGINQFIKFLQKAYALAHDPKAKKELTWEVFLSVAHNYARLAVAKNDY